MRKKRLFDEDADWVPAKGRSFTMKGKTQEAEDTQPVPTQGSSDSLAQASDASKSQRAEERDLSFALKGPAISDAEGLEKAYEAPGSTYTYGDTHFVAGTKGTPLVSSDWIQNYKYLGIPWLLGNPVETSKTDRFKDAERSREATPYAPKMGRA